MQLMVAYCAFDINYPTQYQLLRLLRTELLHDSKDVFFFQSVSYVNLMKRMSASC